MKLKHYLVTGLGSLLLFSVLAGCAGHQAKNQRSEQLAVEQTIARFIERDPSMQAFFDHSHGYAIFPSVGKGAVGIGGAHGDGQVYEQGRYIGDTSLTQVTIGFQLGGQAFSEVIFFEDEHSLEHFTRDDFAFNAQLSAVAATAGASLDADYERGVAVFSMTLGGLMYEASVGGQKFKFYPL